jgi:hypothetical protein
MSDLKVFAGLAFAGAVVLGAPAYFFYGSGERVRVTVTDKERVVTGRGENQSSKYLVFTNRHSANGSTSVEVFENTDALLRVKFNSSTVQGSLNRNSTYDCSVYGFRIPILSMYRNIVSCAQVRTPVTAAPVTIAPERVSFSMR